jgi:hypothetical protein
MCLAIYKPEKVKLYRADLRRAFEANPDGAGFAYYDNSQRRVIVEKGFFQFNEFWRAFQEVQRDNLKAIVHFRWATHGAVNNDNCHPYDLDDGALIHNGMISCVTSSYYSRYSDGGVPYGTASYGRAYGSGGHPSWNDYKDVMEDPAIVDSKSVVTGEYDKNGDYYEDGCYVGAFNKPVQKRSDTREFVEDYLRGMSEMDMRMSKRLIEHAIGSGSKLVTLHNSGGHIIFNEEAGHWNRGAWYSNYCYRPPAPPAPQAPVVTYTPVGNPPTNGNVVELKPTNKVDKFGNIVLPASQGPYSKSGSNAVH